MPGFYQIAAWIDQVEAAHCYASRLPSAPAKRLAPDTQRDAKRRLPLRSIVANQTPMASSSSPRAKRYNLRNDRSEPSRPVAAAPAPDDAGADAAVSDDDDDDDDALSQVTPRARARTTSWMRVAVDAVEASAFSLPPSRASSKRSQSPSKNMADLTTVAGFDNYKLHPKNAQELLGDALALYRAMSRRSQYQGVIPAGVRTHFEAVCPDTALSLADFHYDNDRRRDEYQLRRELDEILEVEAASHDLMTEEEYEPAWNCEVHSSVLRIALRPYEAVNQRNITKASISPKHLVARNTNGAAFDSKMVDFAMCIEPSKDMRRRIKCALSSYMAENPEYVTPSINQTTYPPLRTRPIAVCFETKTPDGSETSARVQLAIWTAAQLEQLRRLFPTADLPTLPVVLASGVRWDVYYVQADKNGVKVIGYQTIGDTESALGIYRLIRCVRDLADWADGSFRQWWERVLAEERTPF
ncbi:hypothetical protein GTA08_BOTSDO12605 [Neofusicoccum parvum]|uniref:Uncharacterized protein n=1 Tax=Neofusicoccum parvum TaxID=310453 RepID=A0ACB5SPX9_9PEZI|nr:hypothetical protein GTA08_BOTSDO12605 [Neofusicoccum parvum]